MAHAGFLLKGAELRQVLPKHPDNEDVIVFGTYQVRPFTDEHYASLVGRTFKRKLTFRYYEGNCYKTKHYVTKLKVLPPHEGSDIPYSLEFSCKLGTSIYPVPEGQQRWESNDTVVCCSKQYNRKSVNFCGLCGERFASEEGPRYVDQFYRLGSVFGLSDIRSTDPAHVFELHDVVGAPTETLTYEWDDDYFYELGEVLAREVGGVCASVSHMDDYTFLISPQCENAAWSIDLWSSAQNYIKLSDIDNNRDAIEALRGRLEALGFRNLEFVVHPEWIE